ncbi:MAG: AMMECR1 domain-containing protein, partial [Termitinemataceae bacterium]
MDLELTEDEKTCLLAEARETIEAQLENRKPVYLRPASVTERLNQGISALSTPCGAFVTLHKGRDLRGCIGRLVAVRPLEETIRSR